MNNILKRDHAYFGPEIWAILDQEARDYLSKKLAGRKIADFTGPQGADLSSVNTGLVSKSTVKYEGVEVGVREVLPVLEFKAGFSLSRDVIESLARGANTFDTTSLYTACKAIAAAENRMVFEGVAEHGIEGVFKQSPYKKAKVSGVTSLAQRTAEAISQLIGENVGGPYVMFVDTAVFASMFGEGGEYPMTHKINDLLGAGGAIVPVPIMGNDIAIISKRGGDYEMISGVDIGIGFEKQTDKSVDLFLFESLTFCAHTPEACIMMEMK